MSPRRRGRGRGNGGETLAAPPGVAAGPIVEDAEVFDVANIVPLNSHAAVAIPFAAARPSGAGLSQAPRRQPRLHVEGEPEVDEPVVQGQKASCTLAQMRRFIKSRPYVPVHELRRRFLIEGIEDEVSPMSTGQTTLFVGLPEREAGFLGELVKAGEVGCELLLDPTSPAIVGVFPMRPVARQ
jgi:hypothetical protein